MKTLLWQLVMLTFLGVQTVLGQYVESVHLPDSGYVQILETHDGSTLYGRVISINDGEIEFSSNLGILKIKTHNIKSLKDVPEASFKHGAYWFENPNDTRLYFSPKARMLKKGTGYFQNIYIFFCGFAYGVTDNFTIGAGTSIAPGADLDEQLIYFTPKVGTSVTDNLDIAAGALVLNIPGEDSPLVGILYGVGTVGTTDNSFTAGLGYGFVDDKLAEKPLIMLGYEGRTTKRTAFVSENFMFPGVDDILVSYGFRFFGEKMAVDLAFWNLLGEDLFFPGIPYVDFIINF